MGIDWVVLDLCEHDVDLGHSTHLFEGGAMTRLDCRLACMRLEYLGQDCGSPERSLEIHCKVVGRLMDQNDSSIELRLHIDWISVRRQFGMACDFVDLDKHQTVWIAKC